MRPLISTAIILAASRQLINRVGSSGALDSLTQRARSCLVLALLRTLQQRI